MGRIFPNGPVVALILISLLLAGCGSLHAGDGSPGGPGSTPARSGSPSSASQSPHDRAKADAAAILAAFVPPPGASRLQAAPAAGGPALSHPVYQQVTPDIVDDVDWWRVPGLSQHGVLDWEKAHLARQFTVSGYGGPLGWTPAIEQWWTLPDVAGVLVNRWLMVTAIGDGSSTLLRVDADVDWLPARPAWSILPAASIRAVVAAAVPSINDKRKRPAPVTVTDPSRVQKLVALINGLSMPLTGGTLSCPGVEGGSLRLTFLARPGGPALGVALVSDNGCGGVAVTVGSQQVGLAGGLAAQQALTISGLPWTFYQFP